MSTGPRGSLGSQDRILFNDIISDPALDLPYDGVAPTEGDFGIILYAFERDLDVFLITRMKSQGQGQGRLPGSGGGESGEEGGRVVVVNVVLGLCSVWMEGPFIFRSLHFGVWVRFDIFPGDSGNPLLDHIPSEQAVGACSEGY
ncbi:hypothetical protein N7471_001786 [Penicillium samsonianum]|uniref:uncharacterized protein n=1 Tax=Penicillium samsonianum TaxID=1882272 RepID=UPI00254843E9|nr:uncharacterized protein N7471_001786 [Penicillium samsonianum]KAJ6150587.1 hypothetical protein N7471_001786 [Penicillium samsonianum]